jgi:hypothetical protein
MPLIERTSSIADNFDFDPDFYERQPQDLILNTITDPKKTATRLIF